MDRARFARYAWLVARFEANLDRPVFAHGRGCCADSLFVCWLGSQRWQRVSREVRVPPDPRSEPVSCRLVEGNRVIRNFLCAVLARQGAASPSLPCRLTRNQSNFRWATSAELVP